MFNFLAEKISYELADKNLLKGILGHSKAPAKKLHSKSLHAYKISFCLISPDLYSNGRGDPPSSPPEAPMKDFMRNIKRHIILQS